MNVEPVLVLFIALLYGPTVLWLVLRTLRGHRRRLPESFTSEPISNSQLASRDGEGKPWHRRVVPRACYAT